MLVHPHPLPLHLSLLLLEQLQEGQAKIGETPHTVQYSTVQYSTVQYSTVVEKNRTEIALSVVKDFKATKT